ncbi:GNAT family N-acetyltransferase [Corynebacterium ciconiae]|uniref:GNAT family N-acetyltransferase n=1 Tax=Corynebacterium ciconiae TaxID=227319 RepID=UPI0003740CAA|nr:GNAT family N-acetyltransferase [Corynebacterium ciconiae]
MIDLGGISAAATPWLAPTVKRWGAGECEDLVRSWLAPEWERLDNRDFAEQLDAAIPLEVSDPMMWANANVTLIDGSWALSGLRFRNRDLDRPFVDVVATSAPPSVEALKLLADPEVGPLRHFEELQPRCLRITVPDPDRWVRQLAELGSGLAAEVDIYIMAESVAVLRAAPRCASYSQVQLVACAADQAAPLVGEIYAECEKIAPLLLWWATPSTEQALGEAAEQGLLYVIRRDGEDVGVIAAREEHSYGLKGWVMEEKCVHPKAQGAGVSAAATQHLVEQLPELPGVATPVVWGHVSASNVASIRTAAAVGRKVVGGELWVTPRGYRGMQPAAQNLSGV